MATPAVRAPRVVVHPSRERVPAQARPVVDPFQRDSAVVAQLLPVIEVVNALTPRLRSVSAPAIESTIAAHPNVNGLRLTLMRQKKSTDDADDADGETLTGRAPLIP